jgi:hypothetical protein
MFGLSIFVEKDRYSDYSGEIVDLLEFNCDIKIIGRSGYISASPHIHVCINIVTR